MQWRQKKKSSKQQPNRGRAPRPQPRPPQPPPPPPPPPTRAQRPAPAEEPPAESPRRRRRPRRGAGKQAKKPKLSRLQKPASMSLEEWQIELRRQFGREQQYQLKNLGDHRLFSEFDVTNPQTQSTYRVHIRGARPGDNFCSCPDFATNTLGTCKHIEFTLATLERKRGAAAELRAGFQPPHSEVYLHYGARREVRFRPGSECPVAIARLAADYFGTDGALLDEAFGRFENFLTAAGDHDHDLRCFDDALAFVAEVRDAERRRQRVQEAFPRGIRSAAFKDLLRINLYDYQKEAALFAARAGRCLIGDDMGLGKTFESLAAVEIMARLFGVERVLIVCPTSLKHQWEREIKRCVERPVQVINGLRGRRERLFAQPSFFKVMNYDTVYRDLDLINGWAPDLVILDEAQRIKNWTTRTARSVKKIASPYALVLTGTPLENRLEELISIVQFVDRYRLGPTFKLLHEHQVRDEVGKVIGYRNLDRLGKTLEPVLLRRHKDQVLDQLPERIDSNVFVPMTPQQRRHHDENMEIVARIVAKWRLYRFLSEADQRRLMIALQRMRMSCDNTYLVDHHTDFGVKTDEALTLLGEVLETPGTKVVIFSQWLRMHELLVRRLKQRKIGHVLFHGGVPGGKRKDLIDRFRDDPDCRLFLSTDAGGTGLNLQHASVVMNMDLPWNPAVLEQRIGRVHRLGQKQPVRVINFVAQGTIEESMLGVLQFKKALFAGVLDGGETEVFLGGSKLNKFMETVEKVTTAIPEPLLDDAEEALRTPPEGDGEMPPAPGGRGQGRRGRRTAAGAGAGGQPGTGVNGELVRAALGSAAEDEAEPAAAPAAAAANPWSGLLQVGMALLQQLATALPAGGAAGPARKPAAAASPAGGLVQRDERTGETYLKVPLPKPEVLDQAMRALGALLDSFRG
jgi:superfamily II DNA or RNA helicase